MDRWEFILHCGQQDTSKPIRNVSDDALHVSSTHGAQTVDLRVASERLAGGERRAHGVYVRKGEDFSSVYVDTHCCETLGKSSGFGFLGRIMVSVS